MRRVLTVPRRKRPGCTCSLALRKVRGRREDRVRAAPAVSCASWVVDDAHEHTGSAETLRPSLRNGFTAYAALSPATSSFCHRHQRIKVCRTRSSPTRLRLAWHQQRMPGPHGFAVRFNAVRLPDASSLTRFISPCDADRDRRCRVHRIPPYVRDDGRRPSAIGRDA